MNLETEISYYENAVTRANATTRPYFVERIARLRFSQTETFERGTPEYASAYAFFLTVEPQTFISEIERLRALGVTGEAAQWAAVRALGWRK